MFDLLSGLHKGRLTSPDQDRRGCVQAFPMTIDSLEISVGFGLASKGLLP